MIRKIFRVILKVVLTLFALICTMQVFIPKYDFVHGVPFHGDSIYNPYWDVDFSRPFVKGNFHAHESKEGAPLENMYDYADGEFNRKYDSAGYAVAMITDHQYINPECPYPAYEHGYNLHNYHINSFGAREVWGIDIPFVFCEADFMQWQINELSRRAEIISINHPSRLRMGFSVDKLSKLSGYDLIEMDARGGGNPWDIVLSAGRYPMLSATDDSHFPDSLKRTFQNRYTMVSLSDNFTESEIWDALKGGKTYGVGLAVGRTPRGKGTEPRLEGVEVKNDTLFVAISDAVDSILFIGQNGKVLGNIKDKNQAYYIIKENDTYVRTEIMLKNGATVWLNPVARISALDEIKAPHRDTFGRINRVTYNLIFAFLFIWIAYFYKRKKYN